MNSNSIIKLYKLIKEAAPRETRDNFVIGTVKSTEPLRIDIGNNIILTEDFLWLGQMCRPHRVTIPHTHIVDTHFTQVSKAIGDHAAGSMPATVAAKEKQLEAKAKSNMTSYTTLIGNETADTNGNEKKMQISEADLGRGAFSGKVVVTGQATLTMDEFDLTDNGHKHIIDRQITKDVHFPQSDYENSVTLCIEPALATGDRVLMFAFNNFQMYYVAERIEASK